MIIFDSDVAWSASLSLHFLFELFDEDPHCCDVQLFFSDLGSLDFPVV